jgi:hypothetical protein
MSTLKKQLIPGQRLLSIDIFRALTMFLMIFVNDLWTLKDIPAWLEHVGAKEDGMGLADVVFPVFLFIVGLSIPFAVDKRLAAGENVVGCYFHWHQRPGLCIFILADRHPEKSRLVQPNKTGRHQYTDLLFVALFSLSDIFSHRI